MAKPNFELLTHFFCKLRFLYILQDFLFGIGIGIGIGIWIWIWICMYFDVILIMFLYYHSRWLVHRIQHPIHNTLIIISQISFVCL